MSKLLFCRLKGNEKGSAPVRLVLLGLVIFILVYGVVNLGWILNGFITINSAAREGVKIAVANEASEAVEGEIKQAVRDNADFIDFREGSIEIDFAEEVGNEAAVTATGRVMLPISFWILPEAVSLQGSASMRREK